MAPHMLNPIVPVAGLMLLGFALMFDWCRCATRYLYISSEIGILFVALIIYHAAFLRIRWNDPPERRDDHPKPHWQQFARELGFGFGFLICMLLIVWCIFGILEKCSNTAWFNRAIWSGYLLGIYAISIIIIARNLKYINAKALVVSAAIMVYFLSTYEITLLDRGIGWSYNNTVIGYLLGIPLDNVLFVYTVTPVMIMIFYSIVTRRLNDLKAFWVLNLALVPVGIVFELLAVYPLNIWRVFTSQSIWPMGRTSIEEFLFYFLMQFVALTLYAFFSRNLLLHPRK
jgi:hypothetical protein